MSRWQPNARERLERAAVELFVEQGFADTTVPQITARAGLTTRTFFRHFVDKREVLFAVEEEFPALVEQLMIDAPASFGPMKLIAYGLETVAATRFDGQLEYLKTRRTIVESDEGLRERELRKFSALAEAISLGLRKRGLDELTSVLAAQITVTVMNITINRWLDLNGEQSLSELVHDTLNTLQAITTDPFKQPCIE